LDTSQSQLVEIRERAQGAAAEGAVVDLDFETQGLAAGAESIAEAQCG
jgi:hypothetical protein